MSEPVLRGTITPEGVLPILKDIEARRTTGVLRFASNGTRAELRLMAGQLDAEQPALDDGSDAVEAWLALKTGEYEVLQQLPPLPVSQGDGVVRTGSLAVHTAADLMQYCEAAGLTGTLAFERHGRRAEAFYDRGDLTGIQVDDADADVNEIFGWEEGTFAIAATPEAPALAASEPPPAAVKADPDADAFLRVVEVALSTILDEREKRRPARSDTTEASKLRTSMPGVPSKREREATVRIVYRGARGASVDEPSARPVQDTKEPIAENEIPAREPPTEGTEPIPLARRAEPDRPEPIGRTENDDVKKGKKKKRRAQAGAASSSPSKERLSPEPSAREPRRERSVHDATERLPSGDSARVPVVEPESPAWHAPAWAAAVVVLGFALLALLAALPPLE